MTFFYIYFSKVIWINCDTAKVSLKVTYINNYLINNTQYMKLTDSFYYFLLSNLPSLGRVPLLRIGDL